MATLSPVRDLKLPDLAALLDKPQKVDEFERLDLAVNMLFLTVEHSYPITRELSRAVRSADFDGIVLFVLLQHFAQWREAGRDHIRNIPPQDSTVPGVRGGEGVYQLCHLRPAD